MDNQERAEPVVVVVVHDEPQLLAGCLKSLGEWVERTIVIDVGTLPESGHLAASLGATVIRHREVPYAEVALAELPHLVAPNTWVLRLDPDECISEDILLQLEHIVRISPRDTAYRLPMQYYFKERPLYGTPWGGVRHFVRFHRWGEVTYDGTVHAPLEKLFPGNVVTLDGEPIKHYWIRSWHEFIEKHVRYLRAEGPSRAARDEPFSLYRAIRAIAGATKYAFVDQADRRDGAQGFLLSAAFVMYVALSWVSFARTALKRAYHE